MEAGKPACGDRGNPAAIETGCRGIAQRNGADDTSIDRRTYAHDEDDGRKPVSERKYNC